MLFARFFFNDTATTDIYTLSLHDALPICCNYAARSIGGLRKIAARQRAAPKPRLAQPLPRSLADRKSTRLNSSHRTISYAVFCLKKKKNKQGTVTEDQQSKTPPIDASS